jgi:hypothetical protein
METFLPEAGRLSHGRLSGQAIVKHPAQLLRISSRQKRNELMSNRTITGMFLALITSVVAITPVLAQFYVNPYNTPYGNPYYNNYAYRGYAPYGGYGYYHHNHTGRDVAIGAGIGAAVGLLASHHGHRYW